MIMATLNAGEADPFAGAAWLRDPVFTDVPVLDLLHRQKAKGPEAVGPVDVHTLFRKTIELREAPASALLTVTGDDYYHFFINGYAVVQGPEGGYAFAYPYYWLDVTTFLEAGENCLASHAYYQGLRNRAFNSGDNRSGFMLALDVTYPDGTEERFTTDDSWRCHTLEAFTGEATVGYETQFVEDLDLRLVPRGWRLAGFDDSTWAAPLNGRQDHVFVKQITPPLQRYRLDPAASKTLDDGRSIHDFGHEIVGHTRLRLKGEPGQEVTVRHGEELSGPDAVRYKMRANCVYEETVTLTGGEDLAEFYDYRAFRYIELVNAPEGTELWVEVRHHPWPDARARLMAPGQAVEDIWRICANGVRMGSQGGFLDCPSREKGQYLGDAVITARSHLWLTGDASLTKKCLDDFSQSRAIHPSLMAVAPGNYMQEIAEFSLQYPLLLEQYYEHSGDQAYTGQVMEEVFPGLFAYLAEHEDEHGLLVGMDAEKWVLVDWPSSLRDGYDYDYAKDRANTVVNAFYYGALRTAARLAYELGLPAEDYEARAARVAEAFASQLADPETGLYLDAPGSEHSSLHANAIPLFFGLTAGANQEAMVSLIREKRLSCGVYIASYVIEALFRAGEGELAWDLITSEDLHSWNEMLKHGATACLEAWGPDQKANCSWCHPWSSCPIYLIAEYVFGLSPATPGWERIRVAPVRVEGLPALTLNVPHPKGHITVAHIPGEGFVLTAPEGVLVEVASPAGVRVAVRHARSHRRPAFDAEASARLQASAWGERVGDGLGVWIDVDAQTLYLIEGGIPVWQARCATGANGVGAAMGSLKTPLGWHRVSGKLGEGAPWGQVFRSREATQEIWKRGSDVSEDLVLTRVLLLEGEEPGVNQGKNAEGVTVDSKERCIYIHGTNGEGRIGTPSSHGCIRLLNDDVIEAFERIPDGTPVLISAS